MTTKTSSPTLNPPSSMTQSGSAANPAELAARWTEARLVYPLYAALATQFALANLPYPPGELPPARPTRSVFDSDTKWLDSLDEKILAYQLRQLPPETLNGNKDSMRALIQRQLRKADKTDADRDKIDLLLVQFFALSATEEEDIVHREITLEDVARLLRPALAQADPTPLEWCEPLEQILERTKSCQSLRDLMEDGLLEKGRMLKDSAGPMFYDPAALVAFCRFNFLLRRAFIRMLHADLKAVEAAVDKLESLGVKTVDCRGAGFSAAETTAQLRYFGENWRQPFQKDYTHNSVHRAFEQLLAVRSALEDAVARKTRGSSPAQSQIATPRPSVAPFKQSVKAAAPSAENGAAASTPSSQPSPTTKQPEKTNQSDSSEAIALSAEEEADKFMESIWEQLIAAPPSRGRSMSTVALNDTKVLLSSWEVAAFVSEGDQEAEDLRRAVVARALLAVASDKRKRSGDENSLASALTFARSEASYFQGRVEQAKKAKHTEAAVNLGISTKRLLSFIEEAEGLQS